MSQNENENEVVKAMPSLPAGFGQVDEAATKIGAKQGTYLGFHWHTGGDTERVKAAIPGAANGHPYLSVDGEIISLAGVTIQLACGRPCYVQADAEGRPVGYFEADAEGRKHHAVAIMFAYLPSGVVPLLAEFRTTKTRFLGDYSRAAQATEAADWGEGGKLKAHLVAKNYPPMLRVEAVMRMEQFPGKAGRPYQVCNADCRVVSPDTIDALRVAREDADWCEAFQEVQDRYADLVAIQ